MGKLSDYTSSLAQYRRILGYLKPYRGLYAGSLLCMVIFGASDGVVPYLVKEMLDQVFSLQRREMLYLLPVALIIFAIVRAAADFGQQFLSSRIGHLVVRDIRNQLHQRLLAQDPGYFISNSSADLVARSTSDAILLRSVLTDSFASVIRDSIRIIALLIAAITLDPVLAGIAALVFPIGVYPVYRFGRRMRKLSRKGQEEIGGLSALMQESMLGNRVVKIFGREDDAQHNFVNENEKLTRTLVSSERVRALAGPVNEILASIAVSAVILYGGFSVIGGFRSQGDFIAFLISVFLLYDPFKKLSRVNNTIQQGMAGAERIFAVLDSTPHVHEPQAPLALGPSNDLVFDDVSFRYPGTERGVLKNISLTIREGERVALVGFSGAGKSTLVDLIPRFMDPSSGTVKIGGRDLRQVSLRELRSRIAAVGQHTFLFNDTIAANIGYGRAGASRDEIENAARAAHAYEFIQRLPQGFSSVVGEAGFTLSGGERQRIAIARAILKGAPILILDEATASLDNRSEREVQLALERLEQGKTAVVIAHRLSTVRNADRIVVMREGEIAEVGTHESLLAQNDSEYAKLFRLQFAEQEPEGAAALDQAGESR